MITDTELKDNAIRILIEQLGLVEMERFIMLLQNEPFDYTRWRRNLWPGVSVRDLSKAAMDDRRETENKF
jgi:hypothetical protein